MPISSNHIYHSCAVCSSDNVPAVNSVLFPPSFELPLSVRSRFEVNLCARHMSQFLHGLSLDETFDATTFPCDYFYDNDVVEAVFGDYTTYHDFSYLFNNYSHWATYCETNYPFAVSKLDFHRFVCCRVTDNWNDTRYYEHADREQRHDARTLSPRSVKFFAEFMFRFCSLFGGTAHFDRTQMLYCWVYRYYREIDMAYPKYYTVDDDRFFVIVATDKRDEDSYVRKLASYDNISMRNTVLHEKFEIPLTDISEKDIVKLIRQIDRSRISGWDGERPEGNKTWRVFIQNRYSAIGLRAWNASEGLFDY